jgi:hypothetical protein
LRSLPPLTVGEMVLIGWSLTLGLEHRRREIEMRSFGLSTSLPLKSLVNSAHAVLFVAILLRLITVIPGLGFRWAYTYYQMLVSFDAVLMMCEMFTFMWVSVDFGVLTITLVQMITDLVLFMLFFSVILLGFCLALVGLSETAPHEHHLPVERQAFGGPIGGDGHSAAGRVLAAVMAPLRAPLLASAGQAAAVAALAAPPLPAAAPSVGRALGDDNSMAASLWDSPFFSTLKSVHWNAMDILKDDFTNHEVDPNAPQVELALVYQPFWAMFAEFELEELAKIPFGLPLMWICEPLPRRTPPSSMRAAASVRGADRPARSPLACLCRCGHRQHCARQYAHRHVRRDVRTHQEERCASALARQRRSLPHCWPQRRPYAGAADAGGGVCCAAVRSSDRVPLPALHVRLRVSVRRALRSAAVQLADPAVGFVRRHFPVAREAAQSRADEHRRRIRRGPELRRWA